MASCQIFIVVPNPGLYSAVFFLPAEWREVDEVIAIEDQVEAVLVHGISMKDAISIAKENAQTGAVRPFRTKSWPPCISCLFRLLSSSGGDLAGQATVL